MRDEKLDLSDPNYTPGRLLDAVREHFSLPDDTKLARALDFDRAQLHRVRQRAEPVTYRLMVHIMDRTGWNIKGVRMLAGMVWSGS